MYPDVDKVYRKAVTAAATVLVPLTNQFYGDRTCREGPFGHLWAISTHIEDVAPKEMQKLLHGFMKQK